MRFFIALVFVSILAACRGETRGDPPPRPEPAAPEASEVTLSPEAFQNSGVEVVAVEPGRFRPQVVVPATIEGDPSQFARIGSRVPGRVVALRVAVGARVRAGDVLLEVDSVEFHQVSTEYLTAIARDRQAQDALRRARALTAERVGAAQDLQRAEADADAAHATLQEAEEHLHFLGLRDADIQVMRARSTHGQARSAVRAPIDGVVSALRASIGQVLGGTEEVAVVSRTTSVWCVLHIYESDLPGVRVGAAVTFRPFALGDDGARVGALTFLSDVLAPQTRTAEGRFQVNNADGALRPGMSGVAAVSLPAEPGALWLPAAAVQSHEGRAVVFVQRGERAFTARSVRVGEDRGGHVPVLEGVRAGERVAVRGAFTLRSELERGELEEED